MKISSKIVLITALLVCIATFIVYIPALNNDFLNHDDHAYINNNQHIKQINLNFFKWAFTKFAISNWHPFTWISHAVDYAIWGLEPFGHHLSSVFIHSINSMLVVLLSISLLIYYRAINEFKHSEDTPLKDLTIIIAGIISGLLFGIHPIHVESVAWIAERKDVLCAFFFILSLMFYIRYAYLRTIDESCINKSWLTDKNYLLSLLFFVFAIFSKPMAITLPAVLLILDWFPFERLNKQSLKRVFIEKIPFFLISLQSAITTVLAQSYYFAIKSDTDYPLISRILTSIKALIDYALNIIWPFNLSPYYPFADNIVFISLPYLMSFLAVAGIIALVIIKKSRFWAAVFLYYIVTLSPVLQLVKIGSISTADRYMYLPSLTIFLAFGIIVSLAMEKLIAKYFKKGYIVKIALITALCLIFFAMSLLTIKQIKIWKDSITIWEYATAVMAKKGWQTYKNSFDAYNNLAMAYVDAERFNDAVYVLKTYAYRAAPDSMHLYNSLGMVYQKQGNYDDAIAAYKAAIKIYPFNNTIRNNLSAVYIKTNRINEAISELKESLKINPVFYMTHNNIGIAYSLANRFDEAVAHLTIAYKIKPDEHRMLLDLIDGYLRMGEYYENKKEFGKALEAYNNVLSLDKNNAKVLDGILRVERKTKKK